ncbi:MAG: nucleotidyltransferase domain-containing protein [Candidatus Aenigmarchaeota archaeon]|nr:nucleotidyltransferase domain-containing protein [Candidatus Aenigmarchaeota archaeon]
MFKELNNMKFFFKHPNKELNVREASRIMDLSPATTSKRLKLLASQKLLKSRKDRLLTLYRANIESEFYQDLKIFYNIRIIRESGLLKALNEFYMKPTIVLFGSAAYGTDTETSDFDIVVLSEKAKEFPQEQKFEKKLKRKIQLFVVKDLNDLSNKHLANNVLNGIVLQGEIQWI